jgi:hypothetical protein
MAKVEWGSDSDLDFVIHFVAKQHHQISDLVLKNLELREKESPSQPIAWNRASVPLLVRVSTQHHSEPSVPNMLGPSVSNQSNLPTFLTSILLKKKKLNLLILTQKSDVPMVGNEINSQEKSKQIVFFKICVSFSPSAYGQLQMLKV